MLSRASLFISRHLGAGSLGKLSPFWNWEDTQIGPLYSQPLDDDQKVAANARTPLMECSTAEEKVHPGLKPGRHPKLR